MSTVGANPLMPTDLGRLRNQGRSCRCADSPSCDTCRLVASCDYFIEVAKRNKDAASELRGENERLTWKVLGLEAARDEVIRYKAESERQLRAKCDEIGALLEETLTLRHRLFNLTFDDLSESERVKAISRTIG